MFWQVNKFNLQRGSPETIGVHLLDQSSNPVSLAGATAVWVHLKKQDGSVLEKPAVNGMVWGKLAPVWLYTFDLTEADIALLPLAQGQDVIVKVAFGASYQTYTYKSALNIIDLAL